MLKSQSETIALCSISFDFTANLSTDALGYFLFFFAMTIYCFNAFGFI